MAAPSVPRRSPAVHIYNRIMASLTVELPPHASRKGQRSRNLADVASRMASDNAAQATIIGGLLFPGCGQRLHRLFVLGPLVDVRRKLGVAWAHQVRRAVVRGRGLDALGQVVGRYE